MDARILHQSFPVTEYTEIPSLPRNNSNNVDQVDMALVFSAIDNNQPYKQEELILALKYCLQDEELFSNFSLYASKVVDQAEIIKLLSQDIDECLSHDTTLMRKTNIAEKLTVLEDKVSLFNNPIYYFQVAYLYGHLAARSASYSKMAYAAATRHIDKAREGVDTRKNNTELRKAISRIIDNFNLYYSYPRILELYQLLASLPPDADIAAVLEINIGLGVLYLLKAEEERWCMKEHQTNAMESFSKAREVLNTANGTADLMTVFDKFVNVLCDTAKKTRGDLHFIVETFKFGEDGFSAAMLCLLIYKCYRKIHRETKTKDHVQAAAHAVKTLISSVNHSGGGLSLVPELIFLAENQCRYEYFDGAEKLFRAAITLLSKQETNDQIRTAKDWLEFRRKQIRDKVSLQASHHVGLGIRTDNIDSPRTKSWDDPQTAPTAVLSKKPMTP